MVILFSPLKTNAYSLVSQDEIVGKRKGNVSAGFLSLTYEVKSAISRALPSASEDETALTERVREVRSQLQTQCQCRRDLPE